MRSFLLVFALLFSAPLDAIADDDLNDSTAIIVHIRAIRASDRMDETAAVTLDRGEAGAGDKVRVDSRITDLAPKLGKLHYRCFRLISSQREVLPLGKKETVTLLDGNKLSFRPLTLDDKRVGMWIKWKDPSGMQVLDTRMHFDLGESMLAGVDELADSGLILAIDVSRLERHAPVVQPISR